MSLIGQPSGWRTLRKLGLAAMIVGAMGIGIGAAPTPVEARESTVGRVMLAELPSEARRTHELILAGGPFPYPKDGTVFGNRERLLPPERRGYYREYTVPTPGSKDRGARRIVCGGQPPTQPKACYYTADHYASFRRITH